MKKILFTLFAAILLMAIPNEAKASHYAGGEIWYEYIGDAQNPHRYNVFLIVYRDVSGVPMCPGYCPADICITSSCYPTINLTAQFEQFTLQPGSDTTYGSWPGSIVTPELTDCVNANSPGMVVTEAYRFKGTVDLPGLCADYKFAYSESARNSSSNLVGQDYFHITAELNNILGPNTSPKFVNPAAKAFCAGVPFVWSQAAIEPDGDSVRYDFGNPLGGYTCGNPTPINFQPGYNVSAPMQTTNGIQFDHDLGTLRFTASGLQVVVINITVTEFRYDPGFGIWLSIGTSVRDLQIPVVSNADCKAAAANGPQFSQGSFPTDTIPSDSIKGYGFSHINNDSVQGANGSGYIIPVIDYNCFDNVVQVQFDDGVYCETISPDGTDFRIIGPDSVARPVVGVVDNCRPDLVTKNIDLLLHKPLDVDGDYYLMIKNGNDGNTLMNKCGFPLAPYYVIIIRVNNCPVLDYKMLNTSVENDQNIRIDWDVNDTTYSPDLFNSWNIQRASNNYQFYTIDTVNNPYARSYLDTSLSWQEIDGSFYQYAVQLVQNYEAKAPTNIIKSILLTQTSNSDEGPSTFTWTSYDGWDSVAYELEGGLVESGNINWENLFGPFAGGVLEYEYTWPPLTEGDSMTYAFRVKGTEPHNTNNPFISESNWVYLTFTEPKNDPDNIMTGDIPNVFTPNGDMNNDLFLLGENTYSNVSISVYNRWGKLVYEDIDAPKEDYHVGGHGWNGTDQNSGNLLADGTYYILLDFNDEPTGQSEQIKGTLNIFTSGTR